MTDHVSDDDLALYVGGELAAEAAAILERHVDACAACAERARIEARVECVLDQVGDEVAFCRGCARIVLCDRCDHCGAATRVAGYRILEICVHHARGRLYRVEDADGKWLALKELCFVQAPGLEAIEAFEREAKFLCALDHPRIPRFHGSFEQGEGVHARLYLAQEFVVGESLEARLGHHYYEEREIVAIAREVLGILVYLQSRSPIVIHRDVKPANLILRPDGTIVLVDFGAARDSGTTCGSTQVGTFGYMPLEQLAGLVDRTTDLYALGATLLRLLTRREPWELFEDTPSKRMNVSPGLLRVLRKLTARRPADRYRSAEAALADLEIKTARRPRAVRAVRAVFATALVTFLASVSWAGYQHLHADDRALGTSFARIRAPSAPSTSQPPPTPAAKVTRRRCERGRFASIAVFEHAKRLAASPDSEVEWKTLLALVSAYRSTLEQATTSVPDSYPRIPIHTYNDVRRRFAGRVLPPHDPEPKWISDRDIVDKLIWVIDGDVVTDRRFRSSIVIATGDVIEGSSITDSIVIAGGCIVTNSVHGSLLIAGNSIAGTDLRGTMVTQSLLATATDVHARWWKDSIVFGGLGYGPEAVISDHESHGWHRIAEPLSEITRPAGLAFHLNGKDHDEVLRLARAAYAGGDYATAEAAYSQAIAQKPHQARPWRELAMTYEKVGRMQQAKAAYRSYVRLDPNDRDVRQICARFNLPVPPRTIVTD